MVLREDLAQKFREQKFPHPAAELRGAENVVERGDVLSDVHHRLRGVLQDAEPVLDIQDTALVGTLGPRDLQIISVW